MVPMKFLTTGKSILRRQALVLSIASALISSAAPVFAESAKVEVGKVEVIEKTVPEAELRAKKKGEAANTDWTYSVRPHFNFDTVSEKRDAATGQYTVTGKVTDLDVRVNLKLVILLPIDKTERLIAHEHAHQDICERLYREYSPLVQETADKLMGQTFSATGASKAAATAAVGQKIGNSVSKPFMDKVDTLAPKVNAIFDRITDHSIKSIDSKEAEEIAWKEFKEGPSASTTEVGSSPYGSGHAASSSPASVGSSPYGMGGTPAAGSSPASVGSSPYGMGGTPAATSSSPVGVGSSPASSSSPVGVGSSPYGMGGPVGVGSSPYGMGGTPAAAKTAPATPKGNPAGVGSSPYGNGF